VLYVKIARRSTIVLGRNTFETVTLAPGGEKKFFLFSFIVMGGTGKRH
jgi:hypothetical protein